jgi:exodeoxyribonuclease-3
MKIATWNVNGIRARHGQFLDWIQAERPDIACVQEIKAAPDKVPMPLCDLENYWCYWHGLGGYSGVALLVRRDASVERPEFQHPDFDYENRIVTAKLANLVVASVYVPNGGKDFPAKMRFLEALLLFAGSIQKTGGNLIICGDINIARNDIDVHPKERKPTAIGQLPEERQVFEKLLSYGLVDVARTMNPDNDQFFTWWPPWRNMRQRNIGWRIDYILASKPIADTTTFCKVYPEIGTSDHAPLVAEFKM